MEQNSSFNKQLKKEMKKIRKPTSENPFDYTEFFEREREENEIDLGSFI